VFDTILAIRSEFSKKQQRLKRIPDLVRSRMVLLTLTSHNWSPMK